MRKRTKFVGILLGFAMLATALVMFPSRKLEAMQPQCNFSFYVGDPLFIIAPTGAMGQECYQGPGTNPNMIWMKGTVMCSGGFVSCGEFSVQLVAQYNRSDGTGWHEANLSPLCLAGNLGPLNCGGQSASFSYCVNPVSQFSMVNQGGADWLFTVVVQSEGCDNPDPTIIGTQSISCIAGQMPNDTWGVITWSD